MRSGALFWMSGEIQSHKLPSTLGCNMPLCESCGCKQPPRARTTRQLFVNMTSQTTYRFFLFLLISEQFLVALGQSFSDLSHIPSDERHIMEIPQEYQQPCDLDICDLRTSYCDQTLLYCMSCETECRKEVLDQIPIDRDVFVERCERVCAAFYNHTRSVTESDKLTTSSPTDIAIVTSSSIGSAPNGSPLITAISVIGAALGALALSVLVFFTVLKCRKMWKSKTGTNTVELGLTSGQQSQTPEETTQLMTPPAETTACQETGEADHPPTVVVEESQQPAPGTQAMALVRPINEHQPHIPRSSSMSNVNL